MKFQLFNPMITRKAMEIMVVSFSGLLVLNLLVAFFSGSVKDDFVFRNSIYTIGFLVMSYYFIFKGYSSFRYFSIVYGALNFVMLYLLTLIPYDVDGKVETMNMNWINDLEGSSKVKVYIGFMIIQVVLIGVLFMSKSVNQYMTEAEKERKAIMVKE